MPGEECKVVQLDKVLTTTRQRRVLATDRNFCYIVEIALRVDGSCGRAQHVFIC
jgi:hypothetical protein